MKKLFIFPLLLMLAGLAFGQTNVPPCDPNNPPPNCTDYFGVANYANSPLPAGTIAGFTVLNGGSGYANPVVVINDAAGSGAVAGAVTVTGGAITAIAPGTGGTGYIAPQITIVDVGLGGTLGAPLCGGIALPACGSGAMVTATIGPPFTGGIHKFVSAFANLPLAVADTTTFPGSDYYVISLSQYTQRLHPDLPPTTLRGYVQTNLGTDGTGNNTIAPPAQFYLGPVILAQRNRPVRVLFVNNLPTGAGGNLFIPVDTTYMGAGAPYAQNRATLHLHGGATPWISDGTPHQWTTPAGETGPARGASTEFVPDMWFDSTNGNVIASCAAQPTCAVANATNDPGAGKMTFYWTNDQGGRLMFYHDHAYGITRLNVYAGEAAGYLLVDTAEENGLAAATVPGTITGAGADLAHLIPLVIQDKTFVPSATQLASEDPTWIAGGFGTTPGIANLGDLWFPHVYTTNQNPADAGNSNAFGRWDYGPWFFPPQTSLTAGPITIPCTSAAFPNQVVQCPITPNPSGTPEGFMDTPVINGVAYPVLHVAPAAYRFKILSAGNDRSWNLQLYVADPLNPTEVKMLPALPPTAGSALPLCGQINQVAVPSLTIGLVTAILANGQPINGTGLPANCWPNFGQAPGIPIQQTMWAADGRIGGAPDPTTAGPPFIQIGTEGGLLPAPVVIPSIPTGYEANPRSITIGSVSVHGLWLGPAERADVIVDFSAFNGKTLILYNDAPTPAPAIDSRIDFFTGDPDQTAIGGAPTTQPGYGPNTRTVMQIIVDQTAPNVPTFSLPTLTAALPGLFAQTQPQIIVPEPTYPPASGGYSATQTYTGISDNSLTYYPLGSTTPVTINDGQKAIQELFTLDYGRMNATLGVELPLTNFLTQTTIPYGYIDPTTEIIKQGDTQLWKITHNGVDSHFIHFHLFNVQVVNRVGWDGSLRPVDENELGWKDTVRMNPLEDILVALQPITPAIPFPLPDSIRLMDVTGMGNTFTGVDPNNNPITIVDRPTNFGWEYVWHCHILGHEENDMMRPILYQVPPPAPSNLVAAAAAGPNTGVDLTWTDNSASETAWTVQRDTVDTFNSGNLFTFPPFTSTTTKPYGGTIPFNDSTVPVGQVFYRVAAVDDYTPTSPLTGAFAPVALSSTWSNAASIGATGVPFASVSPTALTFGSVALLATSPTQTVTLSNAGTAPFNITGAASFGANAADFILTNNCALTVPAPVPPATSSCTIGVAFMPTVNGAESASLVITTTDAVHPTLTVSLAGTGGLPLLTITASNATMKYGSAVPVITPIYNPPNPVGVTAPTCATTATATSAVGTYPSTCSGAVSATYQITYVAGTMSVTPVPLTIWASNAVMPVGGPVPTIAPLYVGFVAGDTAAVLNVAPNVAPTCTTTATVASPVSPPTYPSSCTGAVDPNYTIGYVNGSVTVAVGVLTITAPTLTMPFGGPIPALTPTYNPTAPVGLVTPAVCTTSATITSTAGIYPITCSGAVDPNYTIGYVAGTLTVTPGLLTVTAPSPTMTYGGPIPALPPTYNPTNPVGLTTPAVCTTSATSGSPVGAYPVNCSGAVDPNYTISYVAGILTVNPAVLTVTASSSSMTYGGTVPTITPSYAGFVGTDTSAVITTAPTCSTTATNTSPASPPTYPSTCTGAVATNYSFTYVPGAVTIIGAPLTITANSTSKVYGVTTTFTGTEFTVTGLLNGNTITSVTLTSTGAAATAAVGSYPIVPSAAVGTGVGNYSITYTNGTLGVTPAPLTITASPASKIYGQTATLTAFTTSGLLNSDTVTSVTLTSAGAPATANVGSYAIVPSAPLTGTGLGNYTIGYVYGSLTVTQASSTTTITSNLPNPAIVGQIVTVSFGVAPQFTGIPTGSVRVTASTGQTCTGVLSGGAGSCALTFTPGGSRTLTATYFTGDLNFLPSAASAPVTEVISSVSLSTNSLLFGNQLVGTNSARQAVTLSNVGIAPLGITGFSVVGTNPADFTLQNNCPVGGTLSVGRSCTINVTFRPTAAGVRTAMLSISDVDATSPQLVSLTGTGTIPIATVAPTSVAFGNQARNTTSPATAVTLTNTGTGTLSGINIGISGANANRFSQNNNCGNSLAPGASCTINVTFRPNATGPFSATLNVNVAAPATPAAVALTGTGI